MYPGRIFINKKDKPFYDYVDTPNLDGMTGTKQANINSVVLYRY